MPIPTYTAPKEANVPICAVVVVKHNDGISFIRCAVKRLEFEANVSGENALHVDGVMVNKDTIRLEMADSYSINISNIIKNMPMVSAGYDFGLARALRPGENGYVPAENFYSDPQVVTKKQIVCGCVMSATDRKAGVLAMQCTAHNRTIVIPQDTPEELRPRCCGDCYEQLIAQNATITL